MRLASKRLCGAAAVSILALAEFFGAKPASADQLHGHQHEDASDVLEPNDHGRAGL